jgi:transcription elongation GreA/GreB family factor
MGVIAYNSPLASALIGHKKGETVEVRLPAGLRTYLILDCVFADSFRD